MATIRVSGKEEKIILAGTEELVASDGAADKNITTKTLLSDRLLSKDVAGNSNVTLTATEAMYGQIVFTGALTGNISVTVPDATVKAFTAYNNTTGAYSLTFKTVSGTGIALEQGRRATVASDGTNVFRVISGETELSYDLTPQLGGSLDANGKQVRFSKGADIASANALTLGADGNYFDITGTTSITSITTVAVGTVVKLHFDGILTLTHHATDLILPSAANITTAAGDEAEFVEYAAGDWRCTCYTRASGEAIINSVSPGMTLLSTVTASASATVDIETTFDATYDNYLLVVSGLRVATDGSALHCLQKIGGSYLTTNTYDYTGRSDTNSTPTGFAAANAAQIVISPSMSNLAAANSQFKMSISNPTSTALFKTLDWRGGFTTSTTGLSNRVTEGTGANQGTGALTGLRFLASAGNITSGTFRLYGLKNS